MHPPTSSVPLFFLLLLTTTPLTATGTPALALALPNPNPAAAAAAAAPYPYPPSNPYFSDALTDILNGRSSPSEHQENPIPNLNGNLALRPRGLPLDPKVHVALTGMKRWPVPPVARHVRRGHGASS